MAPYARRSVALFPSDMPRNAITYSDFRIETYRSHKNRHVN